MALINLLIPVRISDGMPTRLRWRQFFVILRSTNTHEFRVVPWHKPRSVPSQTLNVHHPCDTNSVGKPWPSVAALSLGTCAATLAVCWRCLSFLQQAVINFLININPYPMAFPYGNGMVLHFYQQQESSTTKTEHKVINKRLKTYV